MVKNQRWKGVLGAVYLGLSIVPNTVLAGDKSDKSDANTTVLKFKRPFVIPVGHTLRTQGMVVVSFNIEFDTKLIDSAMEREEVIRDRILMTLMELSHGGAFDQGITDPAIADMIKEKVHTVLDEIYPEGVQQVLIQDLVSRRVT